MAIADALKPNSNFTAETYNAAAQLGWLQGDLTGAEKNFSQCIRIESKLNTSSGATLAALSGLAVIDGERGNFARAERFTERYAGFIAKHRDWASVGVNLSILSALKLLQGEPAEAARLAGKALDAYKSTGQGASSNVTLFIYADALRQQGQLSQSEEAFYQLQSKLEKGGGTSQDSAFYHYGRGQLYMQKGDYERAEKELGTAQEIVRSDGPRRPLYTLLLGALAELAERQGHLDAAMADYAEAIRLTSSLKVGLDRSASIYLVASQAQLSMRYALLLLKRGRLGGNAFSALDHARAQTLMQTLIGTQVSLRSHASSELRLKDRKLEMELSELAEQRVRALSRRDKTGIGEIDKKIAEATTDHDLVEAQMRGEDQAYAILTQPTQPSLRQIQSRLDGDTVLLEYALDKEGSLLFAMDRERLVSFRLRGSADLNKLTRAAYSKFSRSERMEGTDRVESELSDTILGPAASFLKGHSKLLIVADGSLEYIPFAALPPPRGLRGVGSFMGSAFEVANIPSASFLGLKAQVRQRGRRATSIAVLADPVFTIDDPRVDSGDAQIKKTSLATATRGAGDSATKSGSDLLLADDESDYTRGVNLARLLYSREEAEAIAAVSPKKNFFAAVDFSANRATALDAKVTGSRMIHFATHGIFDSKNPAMSGLVFSLVDRQGNPQAGFLGLEDIYRLHLSADLVVMSACETALGEEVKGEGLVGLTWGFIYAGAKNVVASLWRVNDASTAELMRVFYAGIEREGLTPAAALRKAQQAVASRAAWSAPYYWAGFVIEGRYGN